MPPNDSDRDTKPSTPKDNNDNPFIKFKRFADAQIGAVLQGIIGLPSVFSKQHNDAKSRWADLHDDLKRRDEVLGEQQQASQASELSRSRVDSKDDEVNIPVKKFAGLSLPTSAQTDSLSSSNSGDIYGEQDSIELFSPVTKSLFAHLIRKPKDDVDWKKQELLAQALSLEDVKFELQQDLRDDQRVGNALNMIQLMVFNSLNYTTSFLGNCQLLRSPSVLPYVLFSPYSPLALSSMPPTARANRLSEHLEDDFPYCAAFEDLLLASQGRPMAIRAPIPAYTRDIRNLVTFNDSRDREFMKAKFGMRWIERLWYNGILTKEPPSGYTFARQFFETPFRVIDVKPGADVKSTMEKTSEEQANRDTEQDIFDFLERIGGSVSSPLPFRDAMQVMEAFIKDAVNHLAEQENNPRGTKSSSSECASARTAESDPDRDESAIMRRLDFADRKKSTSTQTETLHYQVVEANATRSAESDETEGLQAGSVAPPSTDRVVATTTTTHQTTDENGSVYTSVIIEKVYADGRKSVTTTSRANSPPTERHHSVEEESLDLSDDERCPHYDVKYDSEDERKRRTEKKRKGWFWT